MVRRFAWLAWSSLLVAAVSVAACSGDEGPAGPPGPPGAQGVQGPPGPPGAGGVSPDGGPASCTPNQQVGCQCVGGGNGFQTCAADGLSFGACVCPDSGSTDGASNEGGVFSVVSLPGLSLWVRGDKGIVPDLAKPNRARRWLDQSGNGNNPEAKAGQDGPPIIDPQALNGVDVIESDVQTGFEITDDPAFRFGTGPFGVVFVARGPLANVSQIAFAKGSLQITLDSGKLEVNAGGVIASLTHQDTTKWHTFAVRGPALKLQIDGTTYQTTGGTSTQDLTPNSDPVQLWAAAINNSPMKIAEMIVVKSALSDGDLANIEAYFKAKYGL